MLDTRTSRWSHYMICGIMLALPFERIPSLHLALGANSATIRISQVLALILILLNIPSLWRRRADLLKTPWIWLAAFVVILAMTSLTALSRPRAILVSAYTVFDILLAFSIMINLT